MPQETQERRGLINVQREQIPVNLDEFEEVRRLEVRHQTGSLLLAHPELARVDRMLLRWMTGTLMRSENAEEAIFNWRKLPTRNGRDETESWSLTQINELAIPDELVEGLFAEVHAYLKSSKRSIDEEVATRITGGHGHEWNDAYEARQSSKRSLETLRENGVRISVQPQHISLLQEECEDGACPILDRVKNIRMVTINGFDNSKASLTIHDIFDHFWLYSKLDEVGLLAKYSDFLQSVGNPQTTDIFSREGELVASVAYEFRAKMVSEPDYKPMFDLEKVERVFRRSEKAGTLTDNQRRAWEHMKGLDSESEEAKSIPEVVNSVCIELMEQRRKVGFIRKLDKDFKPAGVLPILDPEYMALIIESHHELHKPENQSRESLLKISAMVEDYLIKVSNGEQSGDLILKLDEIDDFDISSSRVTPERVEWMKNHLGFAANRRGIC